MESSLDRGLEAFLPIPKSGAPLLRQDADQLTYERLHPPHHLDAARAIIANFIKCQAEEILPTGERNQDSKMVMVVAKSADFQASAAEAEQEVFNLVQSLHGRGWVVNRGR
jgi:hypothetical protein